MIEKDAVIAALRTITDPELYVNIYDLGLIYDLKLDDATGTVAITMTLTSPGCPLSQVFEELIPKAVKEVDGVKDVSIELVWDPPWDPDKMSDEAMEAVGIIK